MNDILDNLLNQTSRWLQANGDDIAMSCRIRLARNVVGFPFVSKMPFAKSVELEQCLGKKLQTIFPSKSYQYILLDELSFIDLHFLLERHLVSKEHIQGKLKRAVLFNSKETLSIMINEEDHLRIQMMHSSLDLLSLWEKINKIDDDLEKVLEYSFDEQFGYLTACPTNVGTGLRASVMLHLPGLQMTKQMDKVCDAASKVNLVIRGFYGEGTAALGNFFQISNQSTLGKSEKFLVQTIQQVVPQVLKHEQTIRNTMSKESPKKLQKHIDKALRGLKTAKKISSEKAMNNLSIVRMGVNMGLVKSLTMEHVNQLFLLSQPSHLQKKEKQELISEKRDIKRAQFFKSFFKKL